MQEFTAQIKKHEGIDGAYVEVPFDVEAVFGAKRVKVKAWFDGAAYRGSIVRMGGCYLIGITQAIRKEIGKNPGDTVEVRVEKDAEERSVELPADFRLALDEDEGARAFYEKLPFSHQRDYVMWITDVKREETRRTRIEKAVRMLRDHQRLK